MPTTFEINSDAFRGAVMNIQRRAERQELEEKLTQSFVPTLVIGEMQTTQNQLVFGRRGVGKTHTLKVYLGNKVQEGSLATYVDCTTFGSGLGSDGSPKNVGARFFSKLAYSIVNALMEQVIRMEFPAPTTADRCLDILSALSEHAAPSGTGEAFNYSEIIRLLNTFMVEIGTRHYFVIIDEWAQVPLLAQPYFAEHLKRSLFAARNVTVKIGVVDYTYRLTDRVNENTIGLEKSADIFSDIRMDQHFVWDQNPDLVSGFFSVLLYNHLALGLEVSLDRADQEKSQIVARDLFTQDRSFSELCRASEGNARDFLVMFGRAHADFKRQNTRDRIGVQDVQRAAVNWYREDKFGNIASERGLEEFLQHLVDAVISKKRARAFMVPITAIQHPLLRRLFSGRLLHPLSVEWSHPDKPGERYALVSIDYGTYASFKGTKNAPEENVFWELNPSGPPQFDDLVPLKLDRRSVRRIVIDPATLDEYWRRNSEAPM